MSFETALRQRLKAAAGLNTTAIEWSRRKGYPCIVLSIATDRIGRHMTGLDGWRQPRVQIDVFAKDSPTKEALRTALIAAIAPSKAIGGVRFGRAQQMSVVDMSEDTDTDPVFRDMIEAVMPHKLEN